MYVCVYIYIYIYIYMIFYRKNKHKLSRSLPANGKKRYRKIQRTTAWTKVLTCEKQVYMDVHLKNDT